MVEPNENAGQRDRSPAYPSIPLDTALKRLVEFDAHFKRSPASPERVGAAWSITAKAYSDRIAAALRYFGLLEYQGTGKARQITVSEDGRKYLRAQQEETKREVIKAAALRPKQIAKFWAEWGTDRPADAACLDDLVFKSGFSEAGARDFLKIYDSTITYAKLSGTDKVPDSVVDEDVEEPDSPAGITITPPSGSLSLATQPGVKVKIMDGERVAFTEEGQPGQYLKLIASGEVDDSMLEALEDFVKRQRKRLANWYAIIFTSDKADQEIKNFASALKSKWEAAGMPKGCLARRKKSETGNQIVMLSPEAGALVWQIPAYKSLLLPTLAPDDPNNIPDFTPMGIFT